MGINRSNTDQYQLRLPDGLRDELKASAAANGRSMNAEIVARLTEGTETLRDKFAMAALTGMLASDGNDGTFWKPSGLSVSAYEVADVMIAARKGGA